MRSRHAGYLFSLIALCSAACSTGSRAASPGSPPAPETEPVSTRASASLVAIPSPTGEFVSPSPAAGVPPPDFTESFDALPPHWSFLHIDQGQSLAGPVARDGFLVFELPAPNEWGYALYQGRPYADVTIAAQAQYRTGGDEAAGVICRYDENRGWYELNVYQDQTYQLLFGQWLAPGVARYTPLYRAASTTIRSDSNEIGLECQGHALTPVINGVRLRQRQDEKYGLQQGEIGLAASSFADAPARIAFDSVHVSPP